MHPRVPATTSRWTLGLVRRVATLVAITTFLFASPLVAQSHEHTSFPAERLRGVLDGDGIITIEAATTPGHFQLSLGLWGGYARSPVVLRDADGSRVATLLSDRVGGSFVGSLGLGSRVLVGIELPVTFFQRGDSTPAPSDSSFSTLTMGGLGDFRLAGKWAAFSQKEGAILNVAVLLSTTVPSGGGRAYLGDASPTVSPEIAISRHFPGARLRIGGSLSTTHRSGVRSPDHHIGSEAGYGLGIGWAPISIANRPVEWAASVSGAFPLDRSVPPRNQNFMEARGQVGHALTEHLSIFVGGGGGLISGSGWGSPEWRVFAGVHWSPSRFPPAGESLPLALPLLTPLETPAIRPEPQSPTEHFTVGEILHTTHPVTFAFDSDRIDESSFAVLDAVARILLERPEIARIEIEGHTDSLGPSWVNLGLSQRRAVEVARYLVGQGVSFNRLFPRGYGAARPVASNETVSGREQNRRVVFRVIEVR